MLLTFLSTLNQSLKGGPGWPKRCHMTGSLLGVTGGSVSQAAMEDADDAIACLGLAAIADLCAVDALDFYAAWRVVHQKLPRLPAGPLAATEWISMLQHGTLDALVQPERAAAIVQLLRQAADHPIAQVKHQEALIWRPVHACFYEKPPSSVSAPPPPPPPPVVPPPLPPSLPPALPCCLALQQAPWQ